MSQTIGVCKNPYCGIGPFNFDYGGRFCDSCQREYCSDECASIAGDPNYYQFVEENKPHGEKPTCVLCRHDLVTTTELVKYLLEKLSMTEEEARLELSMRLKGTYVEVAGA